MVWEIALLKLYVFFFSPKKSIYYFQGILHDTNGRMPVLLQDKSLLCIVGQFFKVHSKEDQYHSSCCGCHNLNGSLEQCRQTFVGSSYWIQMLCDPQEQVGTEISWIPKLHHIHWNGQMVFPCDIHVCKSWMLQWHALGLFLFLFLSMTSVLID